MAVVKEQSVKSGGRILDLLELIAMQDAPQALVDLTRALEAPKSSTLMLLRTLVAKGYVTHNRDGRYQLDPIYRIDDGPWVGGSAGILRRIARPEMRSLGARVQETVILGVLRSDLQVRLIDKVVSPRPVRYDAELHTTVPAYCTALGRAMLAFSNPELVEVYLRTMPMPKVTENTIVDPAAFRADLAKVRKQGFALNHEGHLHGACSVASPLLNGSGKLIGALNVGCVTANFDMNHVMITRHLLDSAEILNHRFAKTIISF